MKMAHGGRDRHSVAERKSDEPRSKGAGIQKKHKSVSLKNQIRSTERMLGKDLPMEVRKAQEEKLKLLKQQVETQSHLAIQRKLLLRGRKVKFFERKKIEKAIKKLEKLQCPSSDHQISKEEISEQLLKLKEDLEYVKFFPKTERYVPLFTGDNGTDVVDKRNRLRELIKSNFSSATASGNLEETRSEDDSLGEDDFFMSGNPDDKIDNDEWKDKSTSDLGSRKETSDVSNDKKIQQNIIARNFKPLCRSPANRRTGHLQSMFVGLSKEKAPQNVMISRTNDLSNNIKNNSSRKCVSSNAQSCYDTNFTLNSGVHKPRRKRRPKKKKQV